MPSPKEVDELRNKKGLGLTEAYNQLRKEEILVEILDANSLDDLRKVVYTLAEKVL